LSSGRTERGNIEVIDRSRQNAFEFVVIAGARAKQLLRGCSPRTITTGTDKLVKIAQREVREGKVEKLTLTTGE
jgi:DNA-directed RNA polymerase omega subunit